MDQATKKLLEECSQGCKMAVNSMNQVSKYVTDRKLEQLITEYKEKHEKLDKKTESILKKNQVEVKEPKMTASAYSWVTTEMKLKMNNDSSQVSKLMMDGCNMGIQSIGGFLNQYVGASSESQSLAKELVRTEEEFMKELKQFL